ncbi:DUF445 family protein [Thalassotalea maritima]|uniref:DUF445 family protein n=1 Tax=Thalassotalea maritima TaxID=3242416 RepID=UPI003529BAAF
MNKNFITNFTAAMITLLGYVIANDLLFWVGVFALSGAITNTLAVHMLFEKIPFLYGSGVIPARFEDFKLGIRELMMNQFFTNENIDRFLTEQNGDGLQIDLAPVIEQVDLEPAFDSLVNTIEQSSFASMLAMLGGREALLPLKQPFIEKMQRYLLKLSNNEQLTNAVKQQLEQPKVLDTVREKVAAIIDKRLDELTPQLVKQIIQDMIRKHLGWLVVWGGVFGGLIGLISSYIITL